MRKNKKIQACFSGEISIPGYDFAILVSIIWTVTMSKFRKYMEFTKNTLKMLIRLLICFAIIGLVILKLI